MCQAGIDISVPKDGRAWAAARQRICGLASAKERAASPTVVQAAIRSGPGETASLRAWSRGTEYGEVARSHCQAASKLQKRCGHIWTVRESHQPGTSTIKGGCTATSMKASPDQHARFECRCQKRLGDGALAEMHARAQGANVRLPACGVAQSSRRIQLSVDAAKVGEHAKAATGSISTST